MKTTLMLVTLAALTVSAPISMAVAGPDEAQLKASADLPKMRELTDGKGSLSKFSSELLKIRKARKLGVGLASAVSDSSKHALRGGKLQVVVGVDTVSESLTKALANSGATVVGTYDHPGFSQVSLLIDDPAQLDALAELPEVRVVRVEPRAMVNAGSVANQADVSARANLARTNFGVDGTGVRIGVLSDSFNDTIGGTIASNVLTGSSPQVSGDLPAQVRVLDNGAAGVDSDEGAGMAELIYDLAPGCALSFASAFTSYGAFSSNITALRTDPGNNCKVIVDDVRYFEEPMYQDGPIAQAIDACFAANVPYFSSAANNADNGHERPYFDVNATDDLAALPSGVDLHDFGQAYGVATDTHLQITIPSNASVYVTLHWDEPYGGGLGAGPGSETDLDLFLVNTTTLPVTNPRVLAASADVQGQVGSPQGDACEFLAYTNNTGVTRTAYVIVEHYRGRDPQALHVEIITQGSTIVDKSKVADRTVYGHATAAGCMAVAAMFYGEIDANGNLDLPNGQLDVESFSSKGGNLPHWFPPSGTPRYGSAVNRFKPEITGPDGTNTTFFGNDIGFDADTSPNFFGTSAAAPHVAAVAALMLQRNGAQTASQIYSKLRSTARDAETAGPDFLAGDGLVDANAAVNAAFQTIVVDGVLDASGYTRISGSGITPPTFTGFGSAIDASQLWLAKDVSNLYFFIQGKVNTASNDGILFVLGTSAQTGVTSGSSLGAGGGGGALGAGNWTADFEVDHGWFGNPGSTTTSFFIDYKRYVATTSNGFSGNSGLSGVIFNDAQVSLAQHAFQNGGNATGVGSSQGWEIKIPRSALNNITDAGSVTAWAIVVSFTGFFSDDSTDGLITGGNGGSNFQPNTRPGVHNSGTVFLPVSLSSFSVE